MHASQITSKKKIVHIHSILVKKGSGTHISYLLLWYGTMLQSLIRYLLDCTFGTVLDEMKLVEGLCVAGD